MNIGELQRKLSLWAEQDPERTFYDLYSLLTHTEWLHCACMHVAQNAGSLTAGCDGITMHDFDEDREGNLKDLQKALKAGTFEPYPVRRVYIPKKNGKFRPLGIPSIRDRIVQEAIRMVLEPIYEGTFNKYSFGFRPSRRTMDAIKGILWSAAESKKYFWVIEGDLQSYFDTIHHEKLLKLLKKRVRDDKLFNLLRKYLQAGVMEGKLFRDTKAGTPQGGIASPLLANIYLHELDTYMERYAGPQAKRQRRRAGQANYSYLRYADDFVVLSNGTKRQTEAMKQELQQFLASELHLTLSMEKTKVTHLNDGFQFLGFWIQRSIGGKGVMTTKLLIPEEAFKRCVSMIATATDVTTHHDSVATKIQAVNRIITGWCQYYQYTSKAETVFRRLEHEVFWKMAHWLSRKFQRTMPQVMRQFYRDGTFVTEQSTLRRASEFKAKRYTDRFLKPNPYTSQQVIIQREERPTETFWTGYETRQGMADLRPLVLQRDGYTCQHCGKPGLTLQTAEVDHKKAAHRFKLLVNANRMENLQTLCIPCHALKTKSDRQMESRVR